MQKKSSNSREISCHSRGGGNLNTAKETTANTS